MISRNIVHPTRRQALATAAAVSGAGALTACSGGSSGGALGGGDGSGDGAGVTSLVVATSQAPWNPAYAAVVDLYQEKTGNRVDLREFPNDEVKTQLVNDVRSGSHVFDVYQINEGDMAQFMSNSWVQPFTAIDPGYALDGAIYTYDSLPYWNADTEVFADGGSLTSVPINGNLQIFMYREDVYDRLGLEVPTTWDEVVANGRAVLQAGATKYGGVFRLQGSSSGSAAITYDFQAIMAALGATFFAQDGVDWTPTLDSPEAVQAATILRELAELGPEATTTMGQAQALAAMQAGDAAQTYLVAAAAPQLEDEANSNVVGTIGYVPLPAGPGGARTASGIWSLAVPQGLSAERAAAALDFISFVTSQEAQTAFAAAGGVPIRSDYDASDLPAATQEILSAAADSAEAAVGQLRYVFAAELLTLTEPALADIAAGAVEPAAAMAALQTKVAELVAAQGLASGS